MKIRFLLPVLLLAAIAVASPAADERKGEQAEVVTELGEQMDRMSTAFRKLRRQAGDAASNESSLGYVATMRQAAEAALALTPAKAADVPEADRAKFSEGYRAQMNKLIAALGNLEAAFKAGDNATALKLVSELGALQKSGHREYKKPDKR